MEIVFLESGEDLEAQLRRLKLRKRRSWYMRIPRGKWYVYGIITMLLLGGCLVGAVVMASKYINIVGV